MHLEYQDDLEMSPGHLNQSTSSALNILKNKFFGLEAQQKEKKNELLKLKKIVAKHKVKILVKNYISKINRNNPQRKPPEKQFQENIDQLSLLDQFYNYFQQRQGILLSNWATCIWSLLNVLQIAIIIYIICIIITFPQTNSNQSFKNLRKSSAILYCLDMLLNFTTQKFQNGRKVKNLKEIGQHYYKNGFFVDFISIISFFTAINDIQTPLLDIQVLTFVMALIKIYRNLNKFQQLEYLFIKTPSQGIYFGLVKVFLLNFTMAHFLSICLNLMARTDFQNSWYHKINIQQSHWSIRYIWGYYWGTNIMLTVGFGDLCATNYIEALILVFIQTFSCITLAYNISNVGSLIGQLRAGNAQKQKKLQIFHRISEQNQIQDQLNRKITNFIEESFQVKQFFNFDEQDKVINSLPKGIQSEYRVQANKVLFDNIGFFRNLSSKTLVKLSQTVERKISHPDEIYRKKGAPANFSVIFKGNYGLCYKKPNSKLNGNIIETLSVNKNDKPKIISLDFIKQKIYDFDIKSLSYGIIYFLQEKDFMNCLQQSAMDYQLFCIMRDKDQNILNQNEIYICPLCVGQYHNRFNCSRIHFIPIKQHVVHAYLGKKQANYRRFSERLKENKEKKYVQNLKLRGKIENDVKRYMMQRFNLDYLQKVQGLWNYVKKMHEIKQIKKQKQISLKTSFEKNYFSQTFIPSVKSLKKSLQLTLKDTNRKEIQNIQIFLLREKSQYNQFWDLQTDYAYNFKHYFNRFNPDFLNKNSLKNAFKVKSLF